MAWSVIFHPEVDDDLAVLGAAEARVILKVIHERIQHGEPDKLGKPLAGVLAYAYRQHAHRIPRECAGN